MKLRGGGGEKFKQSILRGTPDSLSRVEQARVSSPQVDMTRCTRSEGDYRRKVLLARFRFRSLDSQSGVPLKIYD